MVAQQMDDRGVLLRQALYRFCAAALLYPEPERIETLKSGASWLADNLSDSWPDPELRDKLQRICCWLDGLNGDLNELQGKWIKLFGVSRTAFCYPYEGATVEPELAGPLQVMLQQEYAQAGLSLAADDLPDHIGVELEFMSFLCGLEIEAVRRKHIGLRQKIMERQRRFLATHICRWLPGLAQRVREADGDIYAEICSVAEQISADEKQRLAEVAQAPVMRD